MAAPQEVRALYRTMLRAAHAFPSYNFRHYFYDRVRRGFRDHATETDPARITALVHQAHQDLALLRRQGAISALYTKDKLVVE